MSTYFIKCNNLGYNITYVDKDKFTSCLLFTAALAVGRQSPTLVIRACMMLASAYSGQPYVRQTVGWQTIVRPECDRKY